MGWALALVVLGAAASPPPGFARLDVTTTRADAVVTIDGELRGLAPRSELLAEGAHEVLVEVPGGRARRATVHLVAGEVKALHLALTAPAPPPPAPPSAGLITAGAGAVALAAGLLLGVGRRDAAGVDSSQCRGAGGWDGV